MKGNNIINSLILLFLLASCSNVLDEIKGNQTSPGVTKNKESDAFLPTELKSVTISATQENGEGFVISSIVANSKGKPNVEDGRINFIVDFETFSTPKNQMTLSTEIFSLVPNGFIKRTFSTHDFSIIMDPGIYILTVSVSKGSTKFPPFKAKMVVQCSSTKLGEIFEVNPHNVRIAPVRYTVWNNRNIYLGNYVHDLSHDVVSPASGGNTNLYTLNLDSNGDGTLEIINGNKLESAGYGIDIINRPLLYPIGAYSSFADDERFITYEIYDECYNSKAIEVSSGNSGIFNLTEKEDLTNPDTRPQMALEVDETKDPSYMMYSNKVLKQYMPFLQQIQEQIAVSVNCGNRVGGINYPQGCDTRLTGTLSIIPAAAPNRTVVGCQISNGSLSIKAEMIDLPLSDGQNYNIIGNYGVNFTITGITSRLDNGYPIYDPVNARLNNYTYTVPGAGDAIGKDVLTTNNCSLQVLMPEQSRTHNACGGDLEGTGTYSTIQHVRVAYQCPNVLSIVGKKMKAAGELYCTNGIVSMRSDCKNNNPPPSPTSGGITPVPTSPPPPTPVAE